MYPRLVALLGRYSCRSVLWRPPGRTPSAAGTSSHPRSFGLGEYLGDCGYMLSVVFYSYILNDMDDMVYDIWLNGI